MTRDGDSDNRAPSAGGHSDGHGNRESNETQSFFDDGVGGSDNDNGNGSNVSSGEGLGTKSSSNQHRHPIGRASDRGEAEALSDSASISAATSVHGHMLHRMRQDSGGPYARRAVPDTRPSSGASHHGGSASVSVSDEFRDLPTPSERIANYARKQWRAQLASKQTACDWFAAFVPALAWLPEYPWRSALPQDLMSGLTVGIMVVPQSMSYAKLAGLPVEYGLYAALVPVYAYSVFGSSRQLAVGPVALISLLLFTGLTLLLDDAGVTPQSLPGGQEEYQQIYITLTIQTSALVGVCYIVMGILRLGFVTQFLSHAVISGFTTGAAVIIGMSQLKHVLGYDIAGSKVLHTLLYDVFKDIGKFHYPTFIVGSLSTLALLGLKHLGKTYPKFSWARAIGPLLVTVIAIVAQILLDLEGKGIKIVKTIPRGFPDVTFDRWTQPLGGNSEIASRIPAGELFLVVMSITIVGFMESIAIAKQLATKHKYEIDSSAELIGLGMANLSAGLFQGYPVTGSFSRSAVNSDAKSSIAGMVTATMVAVVLLLLTSVFEQLPLSVLAAIVISGVIGLLDYPEAIHLWHVHTFDFLVWLVACLGTLFLGVEMGLAIAVIVSLLLVVYESAYPHTAVLGRLPGTSIYRNIKQYHDAEQFDGIVMVRVDAPIYFANTQHVREKIVKYERQADLALQQRRADNDDVEVADSKMAFPRAVRYVILELSPVSHVDTSALHILHDMHRMYEDRNVQLCFCNPSRTVMETFVVSGLAEKVGRDHIFVSAHDAVHHCLQEMDAHDSGESAVTPATSAASGSDADGEAVHKLNRTQSISDDVPSSTTMAA